MFQDSKESRLPSLLSYSVVKEPATFDRVGSVLRTTWLSRRFVRTADPALGSWTTCRNPLLFQLVTAPFASSRPLPPFHAPGLSHNCERPSVISRTRTRLHCSARLTPART